MTRNLLFSFLILLLLMPALSNCKKVLDISEPDQLTSAKVFNDDSLAFAGLIGIYYQMMREPGNLLNGGVSVLAGLSADEITPLQFRRDMEFFINDIQDRNPILNDTLWIKGYRYVYYCNTMIEGLTKPNTITPALRDRIIGEAKCLRSFCYYYLSQLFGDVPLITGTYISTNAAMARTPVTTIYQQLVADLKEGITLLDDSHANDFVGKLACEALLARVYLHVKDWPNAELYSNAVIQSGICQLEPNLEDVFKVSSREVIFQLQPADYPHNAVEGYLFQVPVNGSEPLYTISQGLVNSFAANDLRKKEWIKPTLLNGIVYHMPWKYKIATATSMSNEYNVVMRLAEQYLIRAEARARQSAIKGAVDDLNVIRKRAGLSPLAGTISEDECFLAIENERRHELFTEWGHRWFDLRRTQRINTIMNSKWQHWISEKQLFPIPNKELLLNPNLVQNESY